MNRGKLWLITVFLMCFTVFAEAQKTSSKKPVKKTETKKTVKKSDARKTTKTTTKQTPKKEVKPDPAPDVVEDQKKIRNIVSVFEFMLNTLGNSATSARDKDVIVTESYSKIFRDSKVQIEDDLVADRLVVTNKDIMAYLKDVEFFFSEAKFEMNIDNIQNGLNGENKNFYKVSITRNLKATTIDGKTINTTVPRFIEINYDPESQDLKIVSIYTTQFSGKDAMTNWWSQLSNEWKEIFKKKINLTDSATLLDIKNIVAIEEFDLSNNRFITSIEPLSFLTRLKKLNISNTAISDLVPIRNLSDLSELNISNTKVKEISLLRYVVNLTNLNFNDTEVSDISVVEKMTHLQRLEAGAPNVSDLSTISSLSELTFISLEGSNVASLSPLQNLTQLTEINLSQSPITDIAPLAGLKKVTILEIDSTRITNISSLSGMESLKVLHANHTMIADLLPLAKLTQLEKIYCDQTSIKQPAADAFIKMNPKVLIIYDSKDLRSWWDGLSAEWQQIFNKTSKISQQPTKEELAIVTNRDSINLGTNNRIKSLEPLRKLPKLKVITAHNPEITSLTPLENHTEIKYLDISGTSVMDVSPAAKFTKLKILNANKTKVENLDPLSKLATLEKIYADQTGIQDFIAKEFLEKNPKCLLIYKTIHLDRWWTNLSENWKSIFKVQLGDSVKNTESLHKLVESEQFHFKDSPVGDLSALNEFVRLKELHFSGTSISEIPAMENLSSLKSLHATNSPLQNLESLSKMTVLEDLDISNTPIDELKFLSGMVSLKKLNCAGTQIKRLDALVSLKSLEFLDCSNTRVGNIDPLLQLSLKTLKCFNTKVSTRSIEGFKKKKPDCNVVYYR
ncbi:MAG: hypothetical protein HOP08_14915 [Cyclobacteriaceae bacterium]|nr:hypothetical protein [Cyclobacteriaceae bacterium]